MVRRRLALRHSLQPPRRLPLSTTEETSLLSFEESFTRLEKILEQLSAESVPLEQALHLYEEANQLLLVCNHRLVDAEQRIEILSKARTGELTLDAQGRPIAETFQTATTS